MHVGKEIKDDQCNGDGGHNKSKRDINEGEDYKGTHDFHNANDEVFRAMMSRFRNIKEIGDQTTHKIAGFMTIVIRETHALVGIKQILAHMALHTSAHNMSPADYEDATEEMQCIHCNQSDGNKHKRS